MRKSEGERKKGGGERERKMEIERNSVWICKKGG